MTTLLKISLPFAVPVISSIDDTKYNAKMIIPMMLIASVASTVLEKY